MSTQTLNYKLAELPSAQHRAGLAGLVLLVNWLHEQHLLEDYEGAIIEFTDLEQYSVTLNFNLEGIKALLDLTYQPFVDSRWTDKKDKEKEYSDDEKREVERKDKKGKIKLIQQYRYYATVPYGAFLPVWDESLNDPNNGLWVKLWRDMLWSIIRGVPATRNPFNNRLNASYSKDAEQIWNALNNPEKTTGQSGNYYLGAMASNAENVPTKDKVGYQFLLHFWSFVAQVYCPAVLDKEGRRDLTGYVLAIPDVANLRNFCRVFPQVLKSRKSDKWAYLPREAVIDIPEEGALDLMVLLRNRLAHEIGDQQIRRTILGIELIHAEKVPNSGVKILSISYVEPIKEQINRYDQLKETYWCPWFRKQRLLNLLRSQPESDDLDAPLKELPAWYEFDELLSRIPRKWLEDPYFSHDARELFVNEGEIKVKAEIRSYAQIVYQVCQSYVLSKLRSKFDLEWDNCKSNPQKEDDYNKKKYKIANEAFLAVRSRTENQAFIDYFVSTLYPFIRKEEFVNFAEALFKQSSEIRALTLLALSSQFPTSKKSDAKSTETEAA